MWMWEFNHVYVHLQLWMFEHVRLWSCQDVVSKLSLTIDVHRHGSFTWQETIVDLFGLLGQLKKQQLGLKYDQKPTPQKI